MSDAAWVFLSFGVGVGIGLAVRLFAVAVSR